MSELHIYDFDGTLFRSPEAPEGWTEGSWWALPASLNYPAVPDKPGAEWWNGHVVAAAKASIADPDVWAVVVTGRPLKAGGFSFRIPELVHGAGLRFDNIYLSPGGATETFKKKVIHALLTRHGHIDTVHIWEDKADHLAGYVRFVQKMDRVCVPHLVHP